MKKLLTVSLSTVIVLKVFCQTDSTSHRKLLLRPYGEIGIAFIQNSHLKNSYLTNTMFYWGGGLRFGDPLVNNLLPYFQYTRSAHTTENQSKDSALVIQEISAGFEFPVKRFGVQMLRVKVAGIYAHINDDFNKNYEGGAGLQLGIGWEGKLEKKSRVYIDYSYDLIKYSNNQTSFRDYDLGKLTIGVIL